MFPSLARLQKQYDDAALAYSNALLEAHRVFLQLRIIEMEMPKRTADTPENILRLHHPDIPDGEWGEDEYDAAWALFDEETKVIQRWWESDPEKLLIRKQYLSCRMIVQECRAKEVSARNAIDAYTERKKKWILE